MTLKTFIASVLVLSLSLCGCNTVNLLENLVHDAALALPILTAAGVTIDPKLVGYVGAAANCVAQTTPTPTPIQLANIGVCLAVIAAPAIDPKMPPAVQAIIIAIGADIQAFLAAHPAGKVATAQMSAHPHFSDKDVARFMAMRDTSAETLAGCQQLAAHLHITQTLDAVAAVRSRQ